MWSDILNVIRVVLFTSMALGIVYEAKTNDNLRVKCRQLKDERDAARRENDRFAVSAQKRREMDAYNKGLYDARKTDALYRQILDKYSRGDHSTIIMYGEQAVKEVKPGEGQYN